MNSEHRKTLWLRPRLLTTEPRRLHNSRRNHGCRQEQASLKGQEGS